jgi:predicted secreted hydrolase
MEVSATLGCLALASLAVGCSSGSTATSRDSGAGHHADAASEGKADGASTARDSGAREGDGSVKAVDGGVKHADGGAGVGDGGASDGGETDLCQTTPDGSVRLPADDSQHDDEMEWWYWTGHLKTPDAGSYGFEEVFFRTSVAGVVSQLANVALTDIGAQKFRYSSGLAAGAPTTVTNGFSLAIARDTAVGGDGHDTLHGTPQDSTFDLTLDSVKAPVLENGTGYITYTSGGWTYYYSRMLLDVTGTLSVGDGGTVPVTGEAWFDHQWGELLQEVTQGWEWFSIQLDDGRDMMLNFALVSGSPGPGYGTLSDARCHDTVIGASDLTMTSTGTWKSPHTGCTYPSGWRVTYRGLNLVITPDLDDQELYASGGPTYWEGSSTVTGDATGKSYVELNGFCP